MNDSSRAKRQSLAAAIGVPKAAPPPPPSTDGRSRAQRVRTLTNNPVASLELPARELSVPPPPPKRPENDVKIDVIAPDRPTKDLANLPAMASLPPATASRYAEIQLRKIRQGFVRKVFGILSCQLVFTFAIVLLFSFCQPVKIAVQSSAWALFLAAAVMLFFLLALTCFPCVANSYPRNYICLALFTAAEAYLLGACASFYSPEAVATAMGGTVATVVALTIYAAQSRFPWSNCGGAAVIILVTFVLFGGIIASVPSKSVQTAYAALGCLIFSFFILVDASLIVAGSRDTLTAEDLDGTKQRGAKSDSDEEAASMQSGIDMAIHEDDYILAALLIYTDVVNLFLWLLRLLASRDM